MNFLIINGCNLNFLGIREKEIYGEATYSDLKKYLKTLSKQYHFKYKMYQTNHEGKIIDLLQKAHFQKYDGIVINPGAFTHYSIGIYDCLKAIKIPAIEVHLTDLTKRDDADFRKTSVIAPACINTYMGEHFASYKLAIIQFLGGAVDASISKH